MGCRELYSTFTRRAPGKQILVEDLREFSTAEGAHHARGTWPMPSSTCSTTIVRRRTYFLQENGTRILGVDGLNKCYAVDHPRRRHFFYGLRPTRQSMLASTPVGAVTTNRFWPWESFGNVCFCNSSLDRCCGHYDAECIKNKRLVNLLTGGVRTL